MNWGWRICEHVFLLAVGDNDNLAPLVPFPIRPVHGAELPVSISRAMSLAETDLSCNARGEQSFAWLR